MREIERYRGLGERPRREALATLKRCRLLLSTSRHEGGANAVTEALGCGVPVLATNIPGATGLLGKDYPGLYPVGDDEALALLLSRAETDAGTYAQLQAACAEQAWIAAPAREALSWENLLEEVLAE
jgi:glycosyltransferase involved in cell wall biosynthesis